MNGTFGQKLKFLRESKGLNQSELGKEIHMTQRKVSYIECDRFEPNIDDIAEICLYFKISADYLLGLPTNLDYPEY